MRIEFATRPENKYNTEEEFRGHMNSQGVALGIFVVLFASSMTVLLIAEDEATDVQDNSSEFHFEDPLFQGCLLYTSPSPRDTA